MNGEILVDGDSGPLGYVLWYCGSRSQEESTLIQIKPGHIVVMNIGNTKSKTTYKYLKHYIESL